MDPSSWATCNSEMFSEMECNTSMDSEMGSKMGCDISMGSTMDSKLGCDAEMSSMIGSKTSCDNLDPSRNMFIHISEFLILFHPAPVHERGGSKFQGRKKASKDAFNNNFRAWLGLGILETLGTHPATIAKYYGTKKQLAK